MNQLRIYHLADQAAATAYFTIHWPRHLASLPKFGFKVEGVWLGQSPGSENQVVAVVSFPDDANEPEMTRAYMTSPEFAHDMAGFDMQRIQRVETRLMKPSAELLASGQ